MVDAVQDVLEAEGDEAQGGLVPARVELHESRVAGPLERAHGAVRQHEAQHSDRADAEPSQRRVDGEPGLFRLDLVLEQRVEHGLLPDDLRIDRQRRPGDVRQRALVGGERAVGRQRDAHGPQLLIGQQAALLVHGQAVPHPDHDRVAQHGVGGGQVQVAGAALREEEVPHGLQRDAHQQAQAVALRRHERLHGHVDRDVVRDRPRGPCQQQPRGQQAARNQAPHPAAGQTIRHRGSP